MARVSKYKEKRKTVLGKIFESNLRHGRPPTVRDLASEAEVGVATMHSYLTKLAEEGVITWDPNRHRSLRLTQSGLKQVADEASSSA